MNSSNSNDTQRLSSASTLSNNLQNISISSRRSSSKINAREISTHRHRSGVQRTISKSRTSSSRRSSAGTPNSVRRNNKANLVANLQTSMDLNDDTVDKQTSLDGDSNRAQNLLNLSSASTETIIIEDSHSKQKLSKRPIEYFIKTNDSHKLKCSICLHHSGLYLPSPDDVQEYKYDTFSDSNLRSHLGFKHKLYEYLFPSQIKQKEHCEKKAMILPHLKQQLDDAAVECIVKDGLSFGVFRRPGMQHFLNIVRPGYRGPARQTVRRRLSRMYQQQRVSLKEKYKNIPYISLTADIWMNSRRNHFLVITAHYLDEDFEQLSDIIAFRRFRGRHFSSRLKPFLLNEIRKLNIQSKIVSITTDNGSDIRAATSSYEFGIRFSCDAHNIHQTINTGLGLWKIPKPNNKTQTTTTAYLDDDFDDETERLRLIDCDTGSDELAYDEANESNDNDEDDDGDASIVIDEMESDAVYSSSSEDDDDEESQRPATQAQQDHQMPEDNEYEEMEILSSNLTELKRKINCLLRKNRRLIKMINKSSNLTSFIRSETQQKQLASDVTTGSNERKKTKTNDLVNDFYVRWNSTYTMLYRLLAIQPIINNVTFSPNTNIGLSTMQIRKLRSLSNNDLEWELLHSIANVLAPFYLATQCLSGRKYITLSLSFWITQNLYIYLTTETNGRSFENALKKLLLEKFNYYFYRNQTQECKSAKLIAAYLDPFTLADLSAEEIDEAECFIMREATSTIGSQEISTATANEIQESFQQRNKLSTSLKTVASSIQKSNLSIINEFRNSCRPSLITSSSTSKKEKQSIPLTLKQEFSLYLSTSKSSRDFQSYWNEKKNALPILSSFARRYDSIPATSAASESAFSVAGYLDRKQRASLSPTTLRYLMLLKS